MAEGPDPNRVTETDRELHADDQRAGAGLGNLSTTRVWWPSWVSVLVLVVLVGIILAAMLRYHQQR